MLCVITSIGAQFPAVIRAGQGWNGGKGLTVSISSFPSTTTACQHAWVDNAIYYQTYQQQEKLQWRSSNNREIVNALQSLGTLRLMRTVCLYRVGRIVSIVKLHHNLGQRERQPKTWVLDHKLEVNPRCPGSLLSSVGPWCSVVWGDTEGR